MSAIYSSTLSFILSDSFGFTVIARAKNYVKKNKSKKSEIGQKAVRIQGSADGCWEQHYCHQPHNCENMWVPQLLVPEAALQR